MELHPQVGFSDLISPLVESIRQSCVAREKRSVGTTAIGELSDLISPPDLSVPQVVWLGGKRAFNVADGEGFRPNWIRLKRLARTQA